MFFSIAIENLKLTNNSEFTLGSVSNCQSRNADKVSGKLFVATVL